MQAGETYQIQVRQYMGYDMYNLNVGLQKETIDISKYSSVSDSIQYTDQRNVYTFTPSSSGKYRFEIQGLADGSNNEVNILVFNSRGGEEGSTSYGVASGEGLEISDMQAGETYQVQVRYYRQKSVIITETRILSGKTLYYHAKVDTIRQNPYTNTETACIITETGWAFS
jgi:hypothetical protein